MNPIVRIVTALSRRSRSNRAAMFRRAFNIDETTTVLDLGSETGSHIHSVLLGTAVDPRNVYIADISRDAVAEGERLYGFNPVEIDESERLPFSDDFFDIVHCSSVIEHVTVPKDEVWELCAGTEFKNRAAKRQQTFADEIRRVGKRYYVQTPNRSFIVESHTWLPFVGWLPRRILIPVLRCTNQF